MSIKAIGTRLFRHGTTFVRNICRREYNTTNIADKLKSTEAQLSVPTSNRVSPRSNFALRNVGLQFGLHARRIFIDNVLNRVTNTLAAELRKKAARRILFGDSGPFFALVGVSLASGTGILTKEDELEGICWEIREAVSKIKWNLQDSTEALLFENETVTLKDLQLGKPIAKGANAVVYSANLNRPDNENADKQTYQLGSYPFALKMMFNYDIQSSAMSILQAMYKETVPARQTINIGSNDWEMQLSKCKKNLPPHPNVVAMYSVFADYVPELEDAQQLFPAALPPRIYPDGEGRNMSLFMLMKRYDCNLQQYLAENEISMRTSLLLFAQLLEAISHLTCYGIAHRDLKSDNLLLDTTELQAPIAVVSDFGCCLSDKSNGLHLPYPSYEIDKGGNTALMAPEIVNQTPGTFSVLNYSKSDLWAAATIAYEIFGMNNPFYDAEGWKRLRSGDYKEDDLPPLPEEVPDVVKALVANLLQRSPGKRLPADIAANVCQLYLWAPSSWFRNNYLKLPSSGEILQWLLSLTTKVLCESRLNAFENSSGSRGRRTYPEYLLISSFLCRAKLSNIRAALNWMHSV